MVDDVELQVVGKTYIFKVDFVFLMQKWVYNSHLLMKEPIIFLTSFSLHNAEFTRPNII